MDDQQATRRDVELDGPLPEIQSIDDLHSLQAGAVIEVTRVAPQLAKGYLGHLVVPDDGMGDLKEELKGAWGGGTYQLRVKDTSRSGKLNYVQGSARIDIAGDPTLNGKEFVNGMWRPISLVPTSNPATPQLIPASQGGDNTTLQLLQTLLPLLSGNDLGGVDIPKLITAISGLSGGAGQAPARDPYSDIERTLGILSSLRESPMGGASEPARESNPTGLDAMLPLLMQKFMGGQQPQQQPPPQYPGGPFPPYQGAMPHQQPPPQYPQYGQPPQWPAQPPTQPNWTGVPQPGQTQGVAPQPGSPPRPAVPRSSHPPAAPESVTPGAAETLQDDEHEEPFTADDLMADLAERPEAARLQFISDLAEKLGLPEALATQMFPSGPPPAGVGAELTLDPPRDAFADKRSE